MLTGTFLEVREVANTIEIVPTSIPGWDEDGQQNTEPVIALKFLQEYKGKGLFLFADIYPLFEGLALQQMIKSTVDCFARNSDINQYKRLAFFGQGVTLPPEFRCFVQRFEIGYPNLNSVERILKQTAQEISPKFERLVKPTTQQEWAELAQQGLGLAAPEIKLIVRKRAAENGIIGSNVADEFGRYKREMLKGMGVELINQPPNPLGGMDKLEAYLDERAGLFANPDPLIPNPKGVLFAGLPGTGKSLAAKIICQKFGVNGFLLSADAIMGSLVGESEKNIKRILTIAEAMSPIVIWIDEADKAFTGVRGPSGDSGTSSRVFGTLCTFMQETDKPVYFVLTCNYPDNVPSELIRAGRIDNRFYLGLPGAQTREDIARIHLQRWTDPAHADCVPDLASTLAADTPKYTGGEIETIVKVAAIKAAANNRKGRIIHADIYAAIMEIEPQALSNPEMVKTIKQSCEKFTPASSYNDTFDSRTEAGPAAIVNI
jgi:hypothetical protein